MAISPDQIKLLRERLARERLAEERKVNIRRVFLNHIRAQLISGRFWVNEGPTLPPLPFGDEKDMTWRK